MDTDTKNNTEVIQMLEINHMGVVGEGGGSTATCYSAGPNAAHYNAEGEVVSWAKCINCNWGGATRLRSQFNHAYYMDAMQAYNLAGHLQCPGQNKISGNAYPANN